VLEAFDAARYAQPIIRAQFISLSFEKSLRICAWDRRSAGGNTTLKGSDKRRVRCAETMESGNSSRCLFSLRQ